MLNPAHTLRGLRGDEDDDDQESKTWETVATFDADIDRDNDRRDNSGKGYYDGDDAPVRDFGRAATPAEARALDAVVAGYIGAAVAGDGNTACALMTTSAATSATLYAGAGGPSYLRGAHGCGQVMTRLLARDAGEFTGAIEAVAARVAGADGDVLLGSGRQPARLLRLRREGAAWKVDALLVVPLP